MINMITTPSLELKILDYLEEASSKCPIPISEKILWTWGTGIRGKEAFSGCIDTNSVKAARASYKQYGHTLLNPEEIFENIDKKILLEQLYDDAKNIFISQSRSLLTTDDIVVLEKDLIEVIDNVRLDEITLTELHKIKACAPSIYDSAFQTAVISLKLAKEMSYEKEIQQAVGLGALLSNISLAGLGVYDLSELESREISDLQFKRLLAHPEKSATVVLNLIKNRVNDIIKLAAEYIKKHHENIDGTGYYGFKAEDIPIPAQIIRVSESYVAMTNSGYKEQKEPIFALADLQKFSGTRYSPNIIELLSSYLPALNIKRVYTPDEKEEVLTNYKHLKASLEDEGKKIDSVEIGYIEQMMGICKRTFWVGHDANNASSTFVGYYGMISNNIINELQGRRCTEKEESVYQTALKLNENLNKFTSLAQKHKIPDDIKKRNDRLDISLCGVEKERDIIKMGGLLEIIEDKTIIIKEFFKQRMEQNSLYRGVSYKDLFNNIQKSIDKTKEIIGSLQRKEEAYTLERVLMTEVKSLEDMPLYKSLGVNLEVDYKISKIAVYGDSVEMGRVIQNIFLNALHAMEDVEGKKLTIKTEKDDSFAYITISNTGKEIPDYILQNIFKGVTTKKTGSGVGMSSSKDIVESYGGRISVESLNGLTSFKIDLPIHNDL